MKIEVVKQAQFTHSREMPNKELRHLVKDQFSVAVRRMDNFTLTGLAAVAKLEIEHSESQEFSLISCAQYFSVELVQQLILDVQNGKAIRPLDFVSTVGNAANFYIAKEFGIYGSNLFLGADKQAIEKALIMGALELASKPKQQVVVLLWQETQKQRSCHAILIQNNDNSTIKGIETISLKYLLKEKQPTPFLLEIDDPSSLF